MTQVMIIVGGAGTLVLLLAVAIVLKKTHGDKNGKPSRTKVLASSLSKEKLKSDIILNGIDDGVVLIDTQKVIQLFNPAAATITGWPADEAIGLDFNTVLKPISGQNVVFEESQNPFNRVFTAKAPIRDDNVTLVTKDGKRIAVGLSVSPLLDQSGEITGAVGMFRDMSQEQAHQQRQTEFVSTASHEMRTPVAAIEGYLALALNDKVSKVDAKARSYLEKAHSSAQHLGKLFQDLLTSAKAEDGRLTSHPSVIELGAYLEQLTEDLRFSAQKKGLLMEFIIGSSAGSPSDPSKVVRPLYYAYADPDRMREVVTNLFDNAVKYTESGKVSIGLTGNTEIVQFYIKDTGPGIPADDIPHLFQKFYRVDSSATRTIGGTGLGLFICRKIVDLYNGRIWVESAVGKGSTFFINLPRLSTQRATQLQAAEAAQPHKSPLTTASSP